MRLFLTLLLIAASVVLAQKVPPPKQPTEPSAVAAYTLEVEVLEGGKPVAGMSALLFKLGSNGQIAPLKLRRISRISGPDGKMSWEGLTEADILLQLRHPNSGFSLSVPLDKAYFTTPLTIGPYLIRLKKVP